ncbi:MAG: zinc ribbon domain-containing protein [Spirochaetota bacterium]
MRSCSHCGVHVADGEPFCPLCGEGSTLIGNEGGCPRAVFPTNPKIVRLPLQSLIVIDFHLFALFTALFFISAGAILAIDWLSDKTFAWGIPVSASVILLWGLLIIPYLSSQIRVFNYLLFSSAAISAYLILIDTLDGSLSWSWVTTTVLIVPSAVARILFLMKDKSSY